jgi:two-component system sensor histidine kinase AlgZ
MMNVAVTTPPERGSLRAYWLCQVGGWGGYAIVQTYAAAAYLGVPWVRASVELALLHGCGLLLTHLLRGFMRRRHWETLRALALTPRIALASIVPGTVLGILHSFMAVSALQDPDIGVGGSSSPITVLLLHAVNWTAVIAIWCVLYFIIVSGRRRRWAELRESELAHALHLAELRVLKSQLNPHFLFNSLNTVRALIAHDQARAQEAVTQLARTLRYTLNAGQEELVPFERELEIVESYLALESLRFGDRLTVDRDIALAARQARIPTMLLQTLVENAIKHGIAELPRGGTLRIAAQPRDASLILAVENPRPLAHARAAGERVGLRNLEQRLQLLFGDGASFELDLSDPHRAIARSRIPLRT